MLSTRYFFPSLVFLSLAVPSFSFAQNLQCVALSEAPVVHAEGVTELVGDITANCQGGQPNAIVTGNLGLLLSVNITNRIDAGSITDIRFISDNGSGPVTSPVQAQLFASNQAFFNNLSFQLSSTGTTSFRIVNTRGNATQSPTQPIVAQLTFNGGSLISILTNQFRVAFPLQSLLTSSLGPLICSVNGSPSPDDPESFASFLAGRTAISSIRLTEGFATAFAPKRNPNNGIVDTGVRFLVRYSGFPAAAHLFVPEVIVGSNGVAPTSAGNMGLPVSGGAYMGGSDTLLLSLVHGADSTGAGGTMVASAPAASAGVVHFDHVSEIPVAANGGAFAVYEVIAADPFSLEYAQLPTFLSLARNSVSSTTVTGQDVFLAPISSVATASISAPIPRFVETTPGSDCPVLRDCSAPYFPKLVVDSPNGLAFSGQTNDASNTGYIPVRNEGGGVLVWNATPTYTTGQGWLKLAPATGINNGTIRVDASPAGLAQGTYTATIRVNATGGRFNSVPVTLTVGAVNTPSIGISAVRNAYSNQAGLVAGSRAVILGTGLSDPAATVSVDDAPATVIDRQAGSLTIAIPSSVAGKTTATLKVQLGSATASTPIALVATAPLILPGGVLNLDYSVNSASNPAIAGSVFQVFATGLPLNGTITGRVHDLDILDPPYAGPAPGAIGIQQVNLQIHPLFPTFQTYIYVCGQTADTPRVCSPAVPIWLKAQARP